jgi:hypothetical protein
MGVSCKGGITPFKGVCDATHCDETHPSICVKMDVLHPEEASRGSGVLMIKRTRCFKNKCAVFKAGLCIDLRYDLCKDPKHKANQVYCDKYDGGKDNQLWSSAYNMKKWHDGDGKSVVHSIADEPKIKWQSAMRHQKSMFGRYAQDLLRKFNNTLPEIYSCSDTRNPFLVQKPANHPWSRLGSDVHKDATLARFTIMNF